jgi:hypothetical protein
VGDAHHQTDVVVFEHGGGWWWGVMSRAGRLVAVSPIEYPKREDAVVAAMGAGVQIAIEKRIGWRCECSSDPCDCVRTVYLMSRR